MKKLVALLLSAAIFLTGCSPSVSEGEGSLSVQTEAVLTTAEEAEETTVDDSSWTDVELQYNSLDDEELHAHIEDLVYTETVNALDSEKYFVENVSAIYISQEYIDELAFNSQSNIYFGCTLDDLNEIFQGTRYVFTLGEDGSTVVQELEEIKEADTETILRNVAIGTGVILICVTVSIATAGTGAPAAVSVIFATAAKTAAIMAASSAAVGGTAAAVVRSIETGDVKEGLKAAALTASDEYKWGAIFGAISGGASKAIELKGATLNGLTMNEAALMQKQSGYPLDVIKQFQSMEQYNICKKAGLFPKMVNGKTALVRKIDLNYVDDKGMTNLQRMQQGLAALDPATDKPYQLHHIGQKDDSTLAILTLEEHDQCGNYKIWHDIGGNTDNPSSKPGWTKKREDFWKALAKILGG